MHSVLQRHGLRVFPRVPKSVFFKRVRISNRVIRKGAGAMVLLGVERWLFLRTTNTFNVTKVGRVLFYGRGRGFRGRSTNTGLILMSIFLIHDGAIEINISSLVGRGKYLYYYIIVL